MPNKPNILVVTGELVFPLRASIRDLIFSFKYNRNCNAFFYFTEQGGFPEYLKKIDFDLVVFTDTWAGERWNGKAHVQKFVYQTQEYLKNLNVTKVIHPQDEWIYTDLLNEMINHFNISHVYTCAPQTEWKKIYNHLDFHKIKFHQVLTGYLEEKTVKEIKLITESIKKPSVDIGYRAFKAPPWLGSHGYLKTQIAEIFKKEAPKAGFSIDISTDEKETKSGNDWFNFLASCKYFIGVEGGSTIIDRDGKIWEKGSDFQKQHPEASFLEFEKNCFEDMDGNLGLVAISPRHLEACAAKTCQVLIEGSYNDILIPHKHFIELKKDFSNLDDVFTKMKDESLRKQIINRAYNDIVESGKYSYAGYTNLVINKSININTVKSKTILNPLYIQRNRISENRFWKIKKQKFTKLNLC